MESQENTGTRDCVHGEIYQLKLLMLFLYGGIKNKYSFYLGTEIKEAKKFDDIVFKYTYENKEVVRFIQAKHKKDERKRITADALLSEADSDFSLVKYFFSFEDLKESYPEGSIKDVIICTNVDFHISDLKYAQVAIEPIMDEDKILDIICTDTKKKSVRYKFCKNVAALLKPKLENYHLTKLARRVVECIIKGNNMNCLQKTDVFHIYHLILAKDVINTKDKKIRSTFINNENLSPTTKKFRDLFETELNRIPENKLNLENINEELENPSDINRGIKLVLSKKFGKGYTADQEWPQNVISDDEIHDFLNHLVFAVNQPDEEELGDILKREIGSGFNYITTRYLYYKIFESMLDLLQGKRKNRDFSNSEGKMRKPEKFPCLALKDDPRFFSYLEGKELLDVGRKEIFSYPAIQYEDELRFVSFERNLQFKERDEIQSFLSSEKNIWQIYSDTPWLSSLVIYQELKRSNANFRYLFLPWNYLQEKPKIICDFKEIELMIIICSLTDDKCNEKTKSITDRIDIRASDSEQALTKLICITPDHRDLTKMLTSKSIQPFEEKLTVSFFDLTDVSQESIIQAKIIRFQGSLTKESIKDILRLGEEKINLGGNVLEMLLKNENIDVWGKQPTFSDIQSAYIKTYTQMKSHQVREAIEANPKDIFALEADENQMKELLPDKHHELYNFDDILSTFKPNIHRFILLDTDKGEEQYKELCYLTDILMTMEESGRDEHALHQLKHTESGWLWMCTYNRNTYVQRNFFPVLVGREVFREVLLKPSSYGFKIISGIGRSDLLNLLEIKYTKEISIIDNTCLIMCDADLDLEFLFSKIREVLLKYDCGIITRDILKDFISRQDTDNLINKLYFLLSEKKKREIPATTDKSSILQKIVSLFEKILKCNSHLESSKKSVHWFKACTHYCNSAKFHWHRSEGDIRKIRKIADKNAMHLLPEVNLANSKQRIILLAGEPGAGKSFTLARVAEAIKKLKPASLVMKMELKRYKELLTSKYWNTLSDVLDFLTYLNLKNKNNSFERKILEYLLNHSEGVILLFDGFDELSQREQGCAVALFQLMKAKTEATMWITTRRFDHEKIERELSVLSYTFEPWNINLQIEFLTMYWDTALKFSNQHSSQTSFRNILKKQAKEILDCFQYKLGEVENMTNPLIMQMVAEMHLQKMNNWDNIISPNPFYSKINLRIEDFYRAFVNKKYDIYLHERLNVGKIFDLESITILKKEYTKAYGRLAVKAIFYDSLNYIESREETLSVDTLLKIGLLEGNVNAANFIHHTFAEYFATERITRKLKFTPPSSSASGELWSLLLNSILMFKNGRRFFDDKLTSDEKIAHLLDEIEHKDEVFKIILEQSRYVYSVLWYAAVDNLENSFKFFLKSAKNFDRLKEISVHLFDDESLPVQTCYTLLIKCILKYGKELDPHRLVELIASEEYNILYRCVFVDNLECVRMLLSKVKDSDKIVEIIAKSACDQNFRKTALHVAFENSNIKIVEECIAMLDYTQRSMIFNIRDSFNNLPLDYATEPVKKIFNSRYKRDDQKPLLKIMEEKVRAMNFEDVGVR